MSKFAGLLSKGKGFGKGVMATAIPLGLTTAGVIAGQKFLDFKTIFPNVSPDKFFIKHEGLIKVGAVVVTLAMWQKCPEWLKYLLMGVAIQGALKAARQYTMNDKGEAFFEKIGAGEFNDEIAKATQDIIDFAANTSNTGVGKVMDAKPNDTSKILQTNSNTGVAGMGVDTYDWAA